MEYCSGLFILILMKRLQYVTVIYIY